MSVTPFTPGDTGHEAASADALLALLEGLMDDLWTVDRLLGRLSLGLDSIAGATSGAPRVQARILESQIAAWRRGHGGGKHGA